MVWEAGSFKFVCHTGAWKVQSGYKLSTRERIPKIAAELGCSVDSSNLQAASWWGFTTGNVAFEIALNWILGGGEDVWGEFETHALPLTH